MEVVLKPLGSVCAASGRQFEPGEKLISLLFRMKDGQCERRDVCAEAAATLEPPGELLCRWSHAYKPRTAAVDAQREMRLTLESLFLELTEPGEAAEPENHDLIRFLALFLERRRLLRPRGPEAGGWRPMEHAKLHRVFRIPAGDLDAAAFLRVQEKLGVLLPTAP